MKKIAILLVFTLGTFIVNAQSVVEGIKVYGQLVFTEYIALRRP